MLSDGSTMMNACVQFAAKPRFGEAVEPFAPAAPRHAPLNCAPRRAEERRGTAPIAPESGPPNTTRSTTEHAAHCGDSHAPWPTTPVAAEWRSPSVLTFQPIGSALTRTARSTAPEPLPTTHIGHSAVLTTPGKAHCAQQHRDPLSSTLRSEPTHSVWATFPAMTSIAGSAPHWPDLTRPRGPLSQLSELHIHIVPRAVNDGLALPWYSGRTRKTTPSHTPTEGVR